MPRQARSRLFRNNISFLDETQPSNPFQRMVFKTDIFKKNIVLRHNDANYHTDCSHLVQPLELRPAAADTLSIQKTWRAAFLNDIEPIHACFAILYARSNVS